VLRVGALILVFALGAAAAVGLVSCGDSEDDGLLPGNTAQEILDNLETIETLLAECSLDEAQSAVDQVESQVRDLGPPVDRRLKRNLLEGTRELERKIGEEECVPDTETDIPETTVTDETTTTEETTEEEPDRTTTEETTTQEPPTTTPEPPTDGPPAQPNPPQPPAQPPSGGIGPGQEAG
jgi:hypothetical protein